MVAKCIDWMRYTYRLPAVKPTMPTDDNPPQDEELDRYYRDILPKEILEATKAFDGSVIMCIDSPLMNEIEANLNECHTDAQKERYLFSLLVPFGESLKGCGIAKIYMPTAEINQFNKGIKYFEGKKSFWQTMPEDQQLKNRRGELVGTLKEWIEVCNSVIEQCKERIEWIWNVHNQFMDLTCNKFEEGGLQWGTVECCLSLFVEIKSIFANRLDALLLTHGIDLMRLQKESGLYIIGGRNISTIGDYVGSKTLAQKYIDALPKEQEDKPQPRAQEIPKELNTEKAKQWFEVAVKGGLLDANFQPTEKTTTKAQQALLAEILSEKIGLKETCKFKPFEALWNVSGLAKQRYRSKEIQGTVKGEKEIESVFK